MNPYAKLTGPILAAYPGLSAEDLDFGQREVILGAAFYLSPESFSYAELLLSGGTEAHGGTQDTVLSLGFRYDY